MSSSMIFSGLGLAALGFGGRQALRAVPTLSAQLQRLNQSLPSVSATAWANSKYYRGGFESKMSRREAALILGVSPSAPLKRVKDAHRRVMLLNHPDRGGSPFMATKINEAKDVLV